VSDDAVSRLIVNSRPLAADFMWEVLFQPIGVDAAGDADDRLAAGVSFVLPRVQRQKELRLANG
jgi:hypothetical protein